MPIQFSLSPLVLSSVELASTLPWVVMKLTSHLFSSFVALFTIISSSRR